MTGFKIELRLLCLAWGFVAILRGRETLGFDSGGKFWAGIDYLGEAGARPSLSARSGLLERTGAARAVGYAFASSWSAAPMIKACFREQPPPRARQADPGDGPIPERSPKGLFDEGPPRSLKARRKTIELYGHDETVEPRLNGNRIGELPSRPDDLSPRVWIVPFIAGTLEAIDGPARA